MKVNEYFPGALQYDTCFVTVEDDDGVVYTVDYDPDKQRRSKVYTIDGHAVSSDEKTDALIACVADFRRYFDLRSLQDHIVLLTQQASAAQQQALAQQANV